jgi:hypothetical protein
LSRSVRNLSLIKWSEASRTDAGVHAAGQVVSFCVSLPLGVKPRAPGPHQLASSVRFSPPHLGGCLGRFRLESLPTPADTTT